MEYVTHTYFYCFIFLFVTFLLSLGVLKCVSFLSWRIFSKKKESVPREGYAGGFSLLSPVTSHFPIRFAFLALFFLLLIVAVLLLLPWAMSLHLFQAEGFFVALGAFALFGVGFFYVYKKGALKWK